VLAYFPLEMLAQKQQANIFMGRISLSTCELAQLTSIGY